MNTEVFLHVYRLDYTRPVGVEGAWISGTGQPLNGWSLLITIYMYMSVRDFFCNVCLLRATVGVCMYLLLLQRHRALSSTVSAFYFLPPMNTNLNEEQRAHGDRDANRQTEAEQRREEVHGRKTHDRHVPVAVHDVVLLQNTTITCS